MLSTLLVTLLGGLVVGLLGRYLAPGGRDNIPLWLTVACGIGGMLLGSYLYAGLFDCAEATDCTPGVDWWRHAWQVGLAAVLVVAAATATARRR
ncbi:hypothetical protein [Nocardioides coralli]|uniref:hypothetical protein n=1 Tax=Nocardioides coralli TaxID=2872154 RepID=UPI001CA416DB|nr:hypothetical protein [Nocardioides coralli]QZY30060.1 hypothetical protein K6T13_05085 [Nocardioides coralli]